MDSLHFMLLSNYTAMHVMVTVQEILITDEANLGNAAQAWCRVASVITKIVSIDAPGRRGHHGESFRNRAFAACGHGLGPHFDFE
jgi:hypothetical protein